MPGKKYLQLQMISLLELLGFTALVGCDVDTPANLNRSLPSLSKPSLDKIYYIHISTTLY